MKLYPKIDTLFERGEDFVVTTVLKHPVIGTINPWIVTEKIDGTNIRVDVRPGADGADRLTVGGRSDNAQLPGDLIKRIYETFPVGAIAALRREPAVPITLFGEGYGAGIQKGGSYRPDKAFILFDVLIADEWWMDDATVTEMAAALGCPRVPVLGTWTLAEIVERVRAGVTSVEAKTPLVAEGVVARPVEPLFNRNRERVIIKLKTSDFKPGKR